MAAKIRKHQILNDQIFTVLNKYLHQPNDNFSHLYNGAIHHFEPPKPKLGDLRLADDSVMSSSPEVMMRKGTLHAPSVMRDSVDLIADDFDGEDEHTGSHV